MISINVYEEVRIFDLIIFVRMEKEQIHQIPAKTCYSHIGGKLRMLLMESFIEKEWIAKEHPGDKHFYVTEKGKKAFADLGIDLNEIQPHS